MPFERGEDAHWSDVGLDPSIEEIYRITVVPSAISVVEIVAREMTCNGSYDEIRKSRSISHSIREAIVLDPRGISSVSLYG
jgi:hypothetical protein